MPTDTPQGPHTPLADLRALLSDPPDVDASGTRPYSDADIDGALAQIRQALTQAPGGMVQSSMQAMANVLAQGAMLAGALDAEEAREVYSEALTLGVLSISLALEMLAPVPE